MQSNRSLRRKIKNELDSIRLLYSNNDIVKSDVNEPLTDSICIPSTSTNYNISQISTFNNENISLYQEMSLNSSCQEIQDKFEKNLSNNLSNKIKDNHNIISVDCESSKNNSFKDNLCRWVVECNVPQITVNKLLHLIKQNEIINTNDLPRDCRTLLATPRSTLSNIHFVDPGQYYHFGLTAGITRYATPDLKEIKIIIGIDGLPIAKSSNSQLWPILAYIENTIKIVFPVGIYHGYNKPNDSNNYLKEFISEAKDLVSNGIILNNHIKKVSFSAFICDSPAKAFTLKLKSHSGFSSCTRCIQVGEYFQNRVCYPYCNLPAKRTHVTYVNRKYEEHHVGNTLSRLIEIPGLDVVSMFPLDYMHLVALGVVKKLILLWLHTGPVNTRIPGRNVNVLSTTLLNIRSCIPNDFPRKTREIQDVGRYKASELRFFVIYVGPIVLKNIITNDAYTNFMALHVAMIILLSPDYACYLNYAKELLQYFVRTFEKIYGRQHISHNVHGLLHISDDYDNFGPLDNCSAFPFENFMKELKTKVRKHEKPLEQLINRFNEMYKLPTAYPIIKERNPILNKKHKNGPLLKNISGLQFQQLIYNEIKINTLVDKDSYILTNDKQIVKIHNIIKTDSGDIKLIGKTFERKMAFYEKPVDSTTFNIYIVEKINDELKCWDYSSKKKKMMLIKHDNNIVAMPILHS